MKILVFGVVEDFGGNGYAFFICGVPIIILMSEKMVSGDRLNGTDKSLC